jgi:hypothetical protein
VLRAPGANCGIELAKCCSSRTRAATGLLTPDSRPTGECARRARHFPDSSEALSAPSGEVVGHTPTSVCRCRRRSAKVSVSDRQAMAGSTAYSHGIPRMASYPDRGTTANDSESE